MHGCDVAVVVQLLKSLLRCLGKVHEWDQQLCSKTIATPKLFKQCYSNKVKCRLACYAIKKDLAFLYIVQ